MFCVTRKKTDESNESFLLLSFKNLYFYFPEYFCPFCASRPFLTKTDLEFHVQSNHHQIGSDTDDSTNNVGEDENGENCTRECVSAGAAGARTRKTLGYHLLHLVFFRFWIKIEENYNHDPCL